MTMYKIISAREARTITNVSDVEIQKEMDSIGKLIETEAKKGNRTAIHFIGSDHEFFLPKLSENHKIIVNELKQNGYFIAFSYYGESYVPRTSLGMPGGGPLYRNYGLIISW